MTVYRPSLRQAAGARRPAAPVTAARGPAAVHSRPTPKGWHKERRRGAIAAVTVAFLLCILLSGYGIHAQMSQAAARIAERDRQIALETAAALQTAAVLFVPDDGKVCRRRWIDNANWALRDGGEVDCDEAATWNVDTPSREKKVERRLGAIRSVFQSRATGKVE
jgi:hypothetical protein